MREWCDNNEHGTYPKNPPSIQYVLSNRLVAPLRSPTNVEDFAPGTPRYIKVFKQEAGPEIKRRLRITGKSTVQDADVADVAKAMAVPEEAVEEQTGFVEKKKKRGPPQKAQLKLGCGKCRHTSIGCRECRRKLRRTLDATEDDADLLGQMLLENLGES